MPQQEILLMNDFTQFLNCCFILASSLLKTGYRCSSFLQLLGDSFCTINLLSINVVSIEHALSNHHLIGIKHGFGETV
jgi:hypothetical protein